MFAKGRLLPCERRPFGLQSAAFCAAKCRRLLFAICSPILLFYLFSFLPFLHSFYRFTFLPFYLSPHSFYRFTFLPFYLSPHSFYCFTFFPFYLSSTRFTVLLFTLLPFPIRFTVLLFYLFTFPSLHPLQLVCLARPGVDVILINGFQRGQSGAFQFGGDERPLHRRRRVERVGASALGQAQPLALERNV